MPDAISEKDESLRRIAGLNRAWGRIIVEELVRQGVCVFVVSPGSRSTPLALAVSENSRAKDAVHFDERGAAFHALGWAKATGRPAALICTSGTAAANYLPALVEASQSRAPLIALTADRPPELLDAGANQAIDQMKLFGDYVRWRFDLPCPDENVPPMLALTTAAQAAHRSKTAPAGPVHLNCMFREPFTNSGPEWDSSDYLTPVKKWWTGGGVYTRYAEPERRASLKTQAGIVELIRSARRGLLLVGELRAQEEREAARSLALALKWPTFPDVASGLRLGNDKAPFISYYDQILPVLNEGPDVVIQIGGPFVSKRLHQYLSATPPERHVHVDSSPDRRDPLHGVSLRVQADIEGFCGALAARLSPLRKSEWLPGLTASNDIADSVIDDFIEREGLLSEPFVARHVSRHAPRDSVIFLGNSMPARDMDMYGSPHGGFARVAVNRGASGIDGNIATAAGHAFALGLPVTAVLGDLAALHDLNSLALLAPLRMPFAIIIINNDGGGIFSFLPVAGATNHFERYFASPHGLTFEHAAAQFGLDYAAPAACDEFAKAYEKAMRTSRPVIIEVHTEREENLSIHRALRATIARRIESELNT
jgi:2-succinyl-5-enolpyruvyl-6-hydroxy-3-cyclohexene-1-carboxylate synthase